MIDSDLKTVSRRLLVIVEGNWWSTKRLMKDFLTHQFSLFEDEHCTWIEVPSRYAGVTVVAVKVLGNNWKWQTGREDLEAENESECRIVIAPMRKALGFGKASRNLLNSSSSVEIIPAKYQGQKKARLVAGDGRHIGADDNENPILKTITEFAQKEDLLVHAFGY